MLTGTIARILATCGQTMTVQRRTLGAGANAWAPGTTTSSFYQCTARERQYFSKEIRGGIQQGDVEITIDAATCSSAPQKGDKIAAGTHASDGSAGAQWRAIVDAIPVHQGTTLVLYKLQARP